jgi:hypothetical protein
LIVVERGIHAVASIVSFAMQTLRFTLLGTLLVLCTANAAQADATLFAGNVSDPSGRSARGAAVGLSLLVIGVEFEYSSTSELRDDAAPSVQTGMANVFLQTPVPIGGIQPYLTIGVGGYRERLGSETEVSAGTNSGGGVKISLAGPVRIRIDYRRFVLAGNPRQGRLHRIYAGLNLGF